MDQRQIFQQQPAVETCLRGTSPIDPHPIPGRDALIGASQKQNHNITGMNVSSIKKKR